MGVDDWFRDWANKHTDRFHGINWPPPDSEFWLELRSLFVKHGVTEPVATEASKALFESPPEFPSQHPASLMARVREIWRQANGKSTPTVAQSQTAADIAGERFNREAYAHWATLPDEEKADARRLVRERASFFARTPAAAEMLAIAWAYDPSSVISPEPRRDDTPKLPPGVKTLFRHPEFKHHPGG